MPRSRLWARFLLSGKSGTDAPRHEAAGSDLPPGPASRSGSQAEISRGACCASHVTHPTTPGGAVKGSCAGVPGPLGPDSVWELPRPQIGSHRALRPDDRDQSPRSRASGLVPACLVAVSRNQGQGRANTIRTPGETAPLAVPCSSGSFPPPHAQPEQSGSVLETPDSQSLAWGA
jgi:hypothetical protein